MFAVSVALFAVLIASRGGDAIGNAGAISGNVAVEATATEGPQPAATVAPTPQSPIPSALQERLNALPEKLRNETIASYAGAAITLDQLEQIVIDYENRNPNLRVGSVLAVTDGRLRLEVFTTGERIEVATREDTLVSRGASVIAVDDLRLNELVMVVTSDDGAIAVTIEAFGVAAP